MTVTISDPFRIQVRARTGGVPFTMTSALGGASLPFAFGHAFAKGDIPSGLSVVTEGVSAFQWHTSSTWPDGSVRIGQLAGIGNFTAGAQKSIILSADTATGGKAIAESALAVLAPDVRVQFVGLGERTLASLIRRAWSYSGGVFNWGRYRAPVEGPVMSSWVYCGNVGGDDHLRVHFEVRLFSNNAIHLLIWARNSWFKLSGVAQKTHQIIVTVNGQTKYDSSTVKTVYTHMGPVLWEGWYGTDPQITPKHDGDYLRSTKMVPNYGFRNPGPNAYIYSRAGPSEAWYSNAQLTSNTPADGAFQPFTVANNNHPMSSGGAAPFLGPMPMWEAFYIIAGDPKMWRCTRNNSFALGVYGAHPIDENTNLPPLPASYSNEWFQSGDGRWSLPGADAAQFAGWEGAHQPPVNFLAYITMGHWWCLEELLCWVSYNHFWDHYPSRNGASGWPYFSSGQLRAVSRSFRNMALAAAIAPDNEPWKAEAKRIVGNKAKRMNDIRLGKVVLGGQNWANNLGYVWGAGGSGGNFPVQTAGGIAGYWNDLGWHHYYLAADTGWVKDLNIGLSATDEAALDGLLQHVIKYPVGRCGTNATFNYRRSMRITVPIASQSTIPVTFYPDFATVYANALNANGWSAISDANGQPLRTNSGDTDVSAMDARSFQAYLLPGLAAAVDHGAAGAREAWNRLMSSSSITSMRTTGWTSFNDCPTWGIVPRT